MPEADARSDLDLLAAAAAEAGVLALGYFRRDPKVWLKDNASPVSEADLAVDGLLKSELTRARPSYGWLSEESEDDLERLDRQRVFVVDPIDGTRGFLAGSDEWTISLAIVEGGRPVSAVLLRPVTGELWTAARGEGARKDGASLYIPAAPEPSHARAAGPASLCQLLRENHGVSCRGGYIASLALRIAMVADGRLDLAVAKANARDWDIAAADLILGEAGGTLLGPGGAPRPYNRPDTRHPVLAAAGPVLARTVIDLIAPTVAPA